MCGLGASPGSHMTAAAVTGISSPHRLFFFFSDNNRQVTLAYPINSHPPLSFRSRSKSRSSSLKGSHNESSFPLHVRPESISKVESKPNALTANMVITDQHLSLTRGLHRYPITKTPLLEFQEMHEGRLVDHLKELIKMEQTLEVGLEMAALVNLLKLFNYSHDLEKEKLVIQASSGAQILQDGLIQVKQGQDLLKEAIVQMLHLNRA